MKKSFLVASVLLWFSANAFATKVIDNYSRYIDSCAIHLKSNYLLSKTYLDSITEPTEKNLKERIAEYFYLKGTIENEEYGVSSTTQNYVKSLMYAEKYGDFEVAAMAAAEMASSLYLAKKDSLATIYYDKALTYYTQLKDTFGLLDLMQFPAYAKYANFEIQESIDLVLKDLETYKNVKGDQMYYSFAIFLLTSNYLHLNEIEKGNYYYGIYKSLKGHEFIESNYYIKYDNSIKICFIEYYFQKKNLDSVKHYLDAIELIKGARDYNVQKSLYSYYVDYYKIKENKELEKLYMDSLQLFKDVLIANSLETALEMNDDLYQTNTALSEAANKNRWQKNYKYVLIIFLLILFLGGYYFYRKHENKKKALSTLNSKYSTLKARQEKLTIKNLKFEDFLTSLRKELKTRQSNKVLVCN